MAQISAVTPSGSTQSILEENSLPFDTRPLDPNNVLTLDGVTSGKFKRIPKSEMNFVDTIQLLAAKLKHFNMMSEDDTLSKEMDHIMSMETARKGMETQRMQMLISTLGNKGIELVFKDTNNKEVVGTPTAILPASNGLAKVIIDGQEFLISEMTGAKLAHTQLPKDKKYDTRESGSLIKSIPEAPPVPTAEYLMSKKPVVDSIEALAPKPKAPTSNEDILHIYS